MLYLFALSLWVGGMFLLGILAEIVVRVKLKEQPITASKVMNTLMDIFNVHIVIYTCISVIVVAELVRLLVQKYAAEKLAPPPAGKRRYTREICLGVMIVLAVYMGNVLRPRMHEVDRLKKAAQVNTLEKARLDHLIRTGIESLNNAAQLDNPARAAAAIEQLNLKGQLETLREENPGDVKLKIQFDRYHQQFIWLYTINMILGLAMLYIHGKELARFKAEDGTSA